MAIRYLSGINVDSNTLFVDSTNNRVGIGTTSPLSPLHQVGGGAAYTGEARFGGSSTDFGIELKYSQAGATSGSIYVSPTYNSADVLFKLGAGLGNTNQLVLKGNGNVGIGTTSPNIYSISGATNTLSIQATGTNQGSLLDISATGTGFSGINIGNSTIRRSFLGTLDGSNFVIYTNATNSGTSVTERMRIVSNGNVLINTTTDAGYKLDVSGTGRFTGDLTVGVTSGVNLILEKPTGAYLSFQNGATIRGSINGNNGTDGINLNYGASHTTALAIASTGAATFSSSVEATSFVKTSGTSAQYLMADGSVSTLTNPVTGTGTTNYLPKFTGASTIGDSQVQTDSTGNLMVGSADSGNAGTINVSVGVAGTTAGGIQLWAATNQAHYLQFGDGTTGGQVYAGYIGYAHGTDTLSFGTATADRLTISSTGAATFSSSVTTSGLVTINKQNEGLILTAGANTDASYMSTRANNGTGWLIMGSQGSAANYIQTGTGANESAITTVGAYALALGTNQVERMRITSAGIVGIGTTPNSNWTTANNYSATQFRNASLLYRNSSAEFYFGNNHYYDGSDWRYNSSTSAALFEMVSDTFAFLNAPSGTAGNPITWTSRLSIAANGNVLIGTTTDNGNKLRVQGTAWISGNVFTNGEQGIELGWTGSTINDQRIGRIRPISTPAQNPYAGGLAFDYYKYDGASYNWFEGMRLNGSGNVGIGTTAPSAELQVNKASDVTLALSNSTAVTSGNRGSLSFYNSDVSTVALIRATAVTDNVGTQLEFYTRPAAGSLAQTMTIASTGNVGIGTTSPNLSGGSSGSTILTVSATSSARNGILELNGTRTTLNDYVAYVRMFNNGAATPVADIAAIRGSSDTTGSLTLSTSNAERLRIDSAGNVGIGRTNPSTWLELNSTAVGGYFSEGLKINRGEGFTTQYGILNSYANSGFNLIAVLEGGGSGGTINFMRHNAGSGTPTSSMVITGAGNVGIGTTAPANLLSIGGQSHTSPDDTDRILNFYSVGSELHNSVIPVAVGNNSSATTQPEMVGLSLFNRSTANNTWSPMITFGGLSTSGDYMTGAAGIAAQLPANVNDNNFRGGNLVFYTAGTSTSQRGLLERLRITSSGNVGIGTTGPDQLLVVANSTANVESGIIIRNSHADTSADASLRIDGYAGSFIDFYRNAGLRWRFNRVAFSDDFKISASGAGGAGDVMYFDYDTGNVGIGTTNPSFKLDVGGVANASGGIVANGENFEKYLGAKSFADGVANRAINVQFGDFALGGRFEITITGTYSNANAGGGITKVFSVLTNPSNNIYTNESRVTTAIGPIVSNFAIGELQWDSGSSQYIIPISHIVSSGNPVYVHIKVFGIGITTNVYSNVSLSDPYTLTALSRNYEYYNNNVGIGTTNPYVKLDILGSSGNIATDMDNGTLLKLDGGSITSADFGVGLAFVRTGSQMAYIKAARENASDEAGFLAFATQTAAGFHPERMRITSGGNVGIGTTSGITTSTYAGKLAISDASGANVVLSTGTNTDNAIVSRIISVNANNANSGNEGAAEFYGVTSIESAITTTDSNAGGDSGGYIMLKTKPEAGALAERMRIASNGVVRLNAYGSGGITGSPTYNLAVDTSGNIIELPGGVVDGSGTANYVTKWQDANTVTNSSITDDGTTVTATAANFVSQSNLGTAYESFTTSGTTAIFDTITRTNSAIYQIVIVANPNSAGSGAYADFYYGKVFIGTGYNGSAVVDVINYHQESPLPRGLYGSGGPDLTVTAVMLVGGSEVTEVAVNTSYTIRIKIAGYGVAGANTTVRLQRIM
jgi:hypothetical protein